MVCPNCGRTTNSRVCEGCGTLLQKDSKALALLSIILAAVIIVGAVLIFVLPSGQSDIASAAQTYVAAAYYANKVVDHSSSYASMNDYKEDLRTAMDACRTLQNGGGTSLLPEINFSLIPTAYAVDALEGLDTDADAGDSGGYTDGAKESVDTIISNMQKDAANALEALEALDHAIGKNSSASEMAAATADAHKELARADRVSVVVGSTEISFAGITMLGPIHSAFIGVDIAIDGKTVYLGANGTVMLSGNSLGDRITVIDTQSGSGVVINSKSMANALALGQMLALHFDDLDKPPVSEVFTDTEQFTFNLSDKISRGLGFDGLAAVAATPDADAAASSDAYASENGVKIDLPELIGNWAVSDAVFSPWATIDNEDSVLQMQLEIEKKQLNTIIGGKEGVIHLIFRPDGTGIYYIDVDNTTFMPVQFWWRVDNAGAVLAVFGVASYDYDEWDGYRIAVMQRFQSGDYSDFIDEPNLAMYQFFGADLYEHADLSICNAYVKVSDSTVFEYVQATLAE